MKTNGVVFLAGAVLIGSIVYFNKDKIIEALQNGLSGAGAIGGGEENKTNDQNQNTNPYNVTYNYFDYSGKQNDDIDTTLPDNTNSDNFGYTGIIKGDGSQIPNWFELANSIKPNTFDTSLVPPPNANTNSNFWSSPFGNFLNDVGLLGATVGVVEAGVYGGKVAYQKVSGKDIGVKPTEDFVGGGKFISAVGTGLIGVQVGGSIIEQGNKAYSDTQFIASDVNKFLGGSGVSGLGAVVQFPIYTTRAVGLGAVDFAKNVGSFVGGLFTGATEKNIVSGYQQSGILGGTANLLGLNTVVSQVSGAIKESGTSNLVGGFTPVNNAQVTQTIQQLSSGGSSSKKTTSKVTTQNYTPVNQVQPKQTTLNYTPVPKNYTPVPQTQSKVKSFASYV